MIVTHMCARFIIGKINALLNRAERMHSFSGKPTLNHRAACSNWSEYTAISIFAFLPYVSILKSCCNYTAKKLYAFPFQPSSISFFKGISLSLSKSKAPALTASPTFIVTNLSLIEKYVCSLALCS